MSDSNSDKVKIGDKIGGITFFDKGFYFDMGGDPFIAYISDNNVHTVYKDYLKRHLNSPDIIDKLKNGSEYKQIVTKEGKIDYV